MNNTPLPPPRFSFWWLNPTCLFAAVCGLTLLVAYWQSDTDFQLYRTLKYIKFSHVVLGMLAIFAFVCGSYFGTEATQADKPGEWKLSTVRKWFYFSLVLTAMGYLVWLGVGIKNGASPALFAELVFGDDPDTIEELREQYFTTIPGITTCAQFGLASVLLGTLLVIRGDRVALKWVVGLVCLAAFRAILMSERLALIELAFPPFLLFVRSTVITSRSSRWKILGNALPIVAPLLLILIFGTFEYFRSWKYYESQFPSYSRFVVWRFSGYYTTPHNNGAMAIATDWPRPLPYATIEMLWKFPGVEQSPFGYEKLTKIDYEESHKEMLENFGNPELNNNGGLFQPMLDWGLPLSLVFWLGYGFFSGRYYRHYLTGQLGGLLLYPVILLTITDVPRLVLLCNPRLTPSLTLLFVVAYSSTAKFGRSSR